MDDYTFAEALHDMYCRSSHIDYCGWEYEKAKEDMWTQKYSAHNTYLKYARNIREELPDYSPEDLIKVAKGIRAGMVSRYKGRWE